MRKSSNAKLTLQLHTNQAHIAHFRHCQLQKYCFSLSSALSSCDFEFILGPFCKFLTPKLRTNYVEYSFSFFFDYIRSLVK